MAFAILAVWAWSPGQASLPWSDVNLLIVTDVHSWVAGHPHKDHTCLAALRTWGSPMC